MKADTALGLICFQQPRISPVLLSMYTVLQRKPTQDMRSPFARRNYD